MLGVTSWTQDFCNNVQFDFSDPQKAFSQLQGCRSSGSMQNEQDLLQRFTSNWAEYATHNGVGNALKALADHNVRSVLLPRDDWGSLVTHINGGNAFFSKITSSMSTLITLQIVTIISIVVSLFMVSLYMWRQTSLMQSYNDVQTSVRRRSKECLPGEDIGLLNDQDQINRSGMDYNNQMDYNN